MPTERLICCIHDTHSHFSIYSAVSIVSLSKVDIFRNFQLFESFILKKNEIGKKDVNIIFLERKTRGNLWKNNHLNV